MSELVELQMRFALESAAWVLAIRKKFGFAVTLGESYRSDEQAEINALGPDGRARLVRNLSPYFPELAKRIANNTGSGIRNSLHTLRLASDFNLWIRDVDSDWMIIESSSHEAWKKAGEAWEKSGKDHAWGGRFGDANHISIAYQGRK
jgi:hypothetical protein